MPPAPPSMPPGDAVLHVVSFVAIVPGDIATFNRTAYISALAALMSSPAEVESKGFTMSTDDIELQVQSASVRVKATIKTHNVAVAVVVLAKLKHLSREQLSLALDVRIESLEAPGLMFEALHVVGPRPPPPPPRQQLCFVSCEMEVPLFVLLSFLPCTLVCCYLYYFRSRSNEKPRVVLAPFQRKTRRYYASECLRRTCQLLVKWWRARATAIAPAATSVDDLCDAVPPIDVSVDLVKGFRQQRSDATARADAENDAFVLVTVASTLKASMVADARDAFENETSDRARRPSRKPSPLLGEPIVIDGADDEARTTVEALAASPCFSTGIGTDRHEVILVEQPLRKREAQGANNSGEMKLREARPRTSAHSPHPTPGKLETVLRAAYIEHPTRLSSSTLSSRRQVSTNPVQASIDDTPKSRPPRLRRALYKESGAGADTYSHRNRPDERARRHHRRTTPVDAQGSGGSGNSNASGFHDELARDEARAYVAQFLKDIDLQVRANERDARRGFQTHSLPQPVEYDPRHIAEGDAGLRAPTRRAACSSPADVGGLPPRRTKKGPRKYYV